MLPNLLNCFVVKFDRNSSDEGLDIIVARLFPVLNQKKVRNTKCLLMEVGSINETPTGWISKIIAVWVYLARKYRELY